jgi:hypothetical protein
MPNISVTSTTSMMMDARDAFLEDLELQLTTWIGMERPNHPWEVDSDQTSPQLKTFWSSLKRQDMTE